MFHNLVYQFIFSYFFTELSKEVIFVRVIDHTREIYYAKLERFWEDSEFHQLPLEGTETFVADYNKILNCVEDEVTSGVSYDIINIDGLSRDLCLGTH